MATKKLIIVESPAKARTIQKFIDKNYDIKASMGHIRDLPKSRLGVDVENEFAPSYMTIRGKSKIITELKKAVAKSDEIFIASDPDREGEAIAWHLKEALGISKPWRIELHEITKQAVKEALSNPGELDMQKVEAQKARRVLDRLVGYKLSPLLWQKIQKKLSAGRVQSVALKLICDREKEIQDFVTEEYWKVLVELEKAGSPSFEALLMKKDKKKIKVADQTTAESIVKDLNSGKYTVSSVTQREQKRIPPAPYITSTLQQDASRRLNFKVSKTMQIAQQLYEGMDIGEKETTGLITYMRTDSVRISEIAKDEAKGYVKEKFGEKYIGEPIVRKASPRAQDAHEAIRPTSLFREPEKIKDFLTPDQYRLYNIIWHRFLASQMAKLILKITTAEIACNNYSLLAQGKQVIFPGFTKILKDDRDDQQQELPPLATGDLLKMIKVSPSQHFTQPPARFTEALLIKTLEEKGIGRPSTYSPIVDTIQKREYVEMKEKKFFPTPLGFAVNQLLTDHFPDIINPDFTAKIEERLDQVEAGSEQWISVVKDVYLPFITQLDKAGSAIEKIKVPLQETGEMCEKCGKPLVFRQGRFGKFLACSGYPECKFTKPFIEELNLPCPKADCGGKVISRKTKTGKKFYGCSNYPKCNFSSWDKPMGKNCITCGAFMVLRFSKQKKSYPACSNAECPGKKGKKDA